MVGGPTSVSTPEEVDTIMILHAVEVGHRRSCRVRAEGPHVLIGHRCPAPGSQLDARKRKKGCFTGFFDQAQSSCCTY